MSTTAEQIAALRAGISIQTSAPVQTETVETSQEDELLNRIFELGLFDAIVPSPPDGERIYEYEERRKQFNLIMHDFISEQLNAQAEVFEEEKADLNERLTNTQNLLEKEVIRSADLQFDLDKLQTEHFELKEAFEKSKEEKKYEAPSEPLKNRIASLKQLSADDLIARMEARHAAKESPKVEDLQFRTETTETQPGNNSILPAVEIPKVEFPFQTGESSGVPGVTDYGALVSEDVRNYVKQEIQAFAVKNNLVA